MPRADGFRGLPGGEGLAIGRGGVLRFVATDTGNDFARHRREPTPHQLHGLAIGVERLDGNRRVGRDAKPGRAVVADRHRAENTFHVPGAVEARRIRFAAHALVGEMVADQPQRFDRATRHALQAGTGINIREKNLGIVPLEVNFVGEDRRAHRFADRNGFEQREARLLADQHEVVEYVGEVNAPRRVGRWLAGDEEVFVAERKGMEEFRPGLLDRQVEHGRLHFAATAGNALHRAIRLEPSLGRVEEDQVAHARQLVMAAHDRDEFGRVAGERAWRKTSRRASRNCCRKTPFARCRPDSCETGSAKTRAANRYIPSAGRARARWATASDTSRGPARR